MSVSSRFASRQRATSIAAWAAGGIGGWLVFAAVQPYLPVWLRVLVALPLFTFGPGAGLTCRLIAGRSWLVRLVIGASFGVAFTPMLAHLLGVLGWLAVFPYLAAASAGGVLAYWRTADAAPPRSPSLLPVLLLVLLAATIGSVAFAHRMSSAQGGITIYGEYDSYDLTYYAEIAAELSHTVPPASPFYSGRTLDHPFYPHLLLALVHQYGGVPLLDLYFRYAWLAFLILAVLSCFVFVEAIATPWTAGVAAVLFGAGSNLAYLAAWFLHPAVWDEVIWSHNFQGAGAEVLLYGNWTPALVAMFAGFYAVQASWRSTAAWAIVAGAAFASTIFSKPWIYASVFAALVVMILLYRRDQAIRQRLLLVAASSLIFGAPLLYHALAFSEDAQVTFVPAFLPIPLVMADRIGLREWFLARAGAFGVSGATQTAVAALLALPLFLVGTIGSRLVGWRVFWRGLGRSAEEPSWPLLAWTMVAAFLASSFIVSVPYHESQQIYQFALFLFALFAAQGIAQWRRPGLRTLGAAIVVALAIPGPVQYLHRKWTDVEHVAAQASRGEITLASVLRGTDPERTSVLHDRPNDPSLVGILAERRSVLAWAGYVRGNQPRQQEVEGFFASDDPEKALNVLRSCRPSHVLEYASRDHIAPAVRDQLEFVSRSGDVTLYRVPERLVQPGQ